MKKIEFFKIEGNRINRIRKHCPKCGPGVFLAEHKNRYSCGKCGYTEFKGGARPSVEKEKPMVKPMEAKPEIPIEKTEPIADTSGERIKDDVSPEQSENINETPVESSKPSEESLVENIPEEKVSEKESTDEEKSDSSEEKTEEKTEKESKD